MIKLETRSQAQKMLELVKCESYQDSVCRGLFYDDLVVDFGLVLGQ